MGTREDTSEESNFFLQDSNQVKRKAENFFGSQPNIGGQSSSSSSGFRFPRGRDGRNLKLASEEYEDAESVDKEQITNDGEVEEEKVVKSGSSFRFSERKRRSPDGIGSHGHHGHHNPNAHHDQHAHHNALQPVSAGDDADHIVPTTAHLNELPYFLGFGLVTVKQV